MKIGIDINPILDKPVGKASYLKNILISLNDSDSKNLYYLYGEEPHSINLGENFYFSRISKSSDLVWNIKTLMTSFIKHRLDLFFSVKSFWGPILHSNGVLKLHDVGPIKLPSFYPANTVKQYKRHLGYSLKKARKIIVPSASTKSYLLNKYKISSSKIVKIKEGVPRWTRINIKEKDKQKVKYQYNLPEKYFLFVGTIEPRKNLKTLIDAFEEYLKYDNDMNLLIVGKSGYKHEEIFKYIIDKQLSHKVIFTGHIPEVDLKAVYTQARAFVFPSLHEGFGISPLEAMACKVPVLCSNKGAIGEAVGKSALNINPKDVDDIVRKLIEINEGESLRKKLVQMGTKRVKGFNWRKSVDKLLKTFEQIAN